MPSYKTDKKINGITLFCLGKCSNKCRLCSLKNEDKDYSKVLNRAKDLLVKYKDILVLPEEDEKEFHIEIESSGLLTSNDKFLYSKEFKQFLFFLNTELPEFSFKFFNLDLIDINNISSIEGKLKYLDKILQYFNSKLIIGSPLIKDNRVLCYSNKVTILPGALTSKNTRINEALFKKIEELNKDKYRPLLPNIAINNFCNDKPVAEDIAIIGIELIKESMKELIKRGLLDKKKIRKNSNNGVMLLIDEDYTYITHWLFHSAKYLVSIKLTDNLKETIITYDKTYGKKIKEVLQLYDKE